MALRQLLRLQLCVNSTWNAQASVRMMSDGVGGSGVGKGGGSGGTIRDAGGKFGEMEAAREEEYFRKLQAKQLAELKAGLQKKAEEEIEWHRSQIQEHEEDIARHQKKLEELKDMQKE